MDNMNGMNNGMESNMQNNMNGNFNNQEMNNMNGMGNMNMQGSNPTFTKYLILSILELFCCCQITGIIALVFTCIADSAWGNDMFKYEQDTKRAKTTLIIGLAIGVVSNLVLVFMMGVLFSGSL